VTTSLAIPKETVPKTYGALRRAIQIALQHGKERALAAVERQKVRTSWEIGHLILRNVLLFRGRAGHGAKTIERLSGDLSISKTQLYFMLEFARAYPILPTSGELSWNHYTSLLSINDPAKRRAVAERAIKGDWTIKTLRKQLKQMTAAGEARSALPKEHLPPLHYAPPRKLLIYQLRKVQAGTRMGDLVVDLGFTNYYAPPEKINFPEKTLVTFEKSGRFLKIKKAVAVSTADVFHYRAHVLEVTDGDTFWCLIELGFGFTTKQKLRMRGLDAPELRSRAGIRAKAYVEKKLRPGTEIIIRTLKSDKYDRYLADVFLAKQKNEYLNQVLVDKGYAHLASS
jgi:endonuclease YncB( thermonuclease family)